MLVFHLIHGAIAITISAYERNMASLLYLFDFWGGFGNSIYGQALSSCPLRTLRLDMSLFRWVGDVIVGVKIN